MLSTELKLRNVGSEIEKISPVSNNTVDSLQLSTVIGSGVQLVSKICCRYTFVPVSRHMVSVFWREPVDGTFSCRRYEKDNLGGVLLSL